MLRTFLALPLGELFLSDLQECLPLFGKIQGVKWVDPKQIHLTLHFFGPTLEEEIPKIKNVISPIALKSRPLSLGLKGFGCFPNMKRPRVLWVGLGGEVEKLQTLQKEIQDRLAGEGYSIEKRDFKPHATLGRARAAGIKWPPAFLFPIMETPLRIMPKIVLYKSTLTPQGSFYEILETFSFSQNAAA